MIVVLLVAGAVLIASVALLVGLEVRARRRPAEQLEPQTLAEAMAAFAAAERELGRAIGESLRPAVEKANRELERFAESFARRR